MTDNINKNINQHNEIIENDPKFDNKFSLYGSNNYSLPVVTFSLRGGKKQRTTMVYRLICLWDIGDNYIMIKIKNTKHYERRMRSNKV